MENACAGNYSDRASESTFRFKIVGPGEISPDEDPDNISMLQRRLSSHLESHSYPAANFSIDLRQLKRDILYRLYKFVEAAGRQSAITAIELRINEPEGTSSCQGASIIAVVTCSEHSVTLPAVPVCYTENELNVKRPFPAEVAHIYRRLEALWIQRELSTSWLD
tara:strand:- start:123652 stop:124146 length:495 start_codon:yes stop_codon:yes gene_type:complete